MNDFRNGVGAVLRGGLYASATATPVAVWARAVGLPATIRLANGFCIPGRAVAKETAIDLVRLSYFGADLSDVSSRNGLAWGVSFDEGQLVTPSGIRFLLESLDPTIFAETFIYDIHFAGRDLTDLVVVDAGAFVGDTSLYFAQRGARVFAFEPDPRNFRLLLRNLLLNPDLSERVHPFRAAVGSHGTVGFSAGLHGGSGRYADGEGQVLQVDSLDLEGILEKCPGQEAFLLKADCKGSEFELAQQAAISRFQRLFIEYSADLLSKRVSDLMSSIEAAGFQIDRIFKHSWYNYSVEDHGTLHATRKDLRTGPTNELVDLKRRKV